MAPVGGYVTFLDRQKRQALTARFLAFPGTSGALEAINAQGQQGNGEIDLQPRERETALSRRQSGFDGSAAVPHLRGTI